MKLAPPLWPHCAYLIQANAASHNPRKITLSECSNFQILTTILKFTGTCTYKYLVPQRAGTSPQGVGTHCLTSMLTWRQLPWKPTGDALRPAGVGASVVTTATVTTDVG